MREDIKIMAQRCFGPTKTTLVLATVAFLGACTIQLVTPYDEVMDEGLMTFNQDFLQFMGKIKQEVPGEDGSYASNTDFYNTQQAALGTLVQRAKAIDPAGSCASTEATLGALERVSSVALPQEVKTQPLPTGSCTTILLTFIQEQLTETACFHQLIYGQVSTSCASLGFTQADAQGLQNAPLTTKLTLLDQVQSAVTTSVTAAMTLELAKKPSAT
ncbi:MAG: hypothetical protein AAF637_00165 [Pseudomonadota bacterium]